MILFIRSAEKKQNYDFLERKLQTLIKYKDFYNNRKNFYKTQQTLFALKSRKLQLSKQITKQILSIKKEFNCFVQDLPSKVFENSGEDLKYIQSDFIDIPIGNLFSCYMYYV